MALSFDQFVSHLTDSGLITAEDLTSFVSSLPEDRRPNDGEQLARELVKQKKLTKFQAEQIYLGKGKSLVLGNYTILDKLGQGGMGMVLKAEHKRLKRLVALKVMSPAAHKTPDALKRFHREVEAAAKLRHPNVVATDDADEAKGTHFLVMEYVEGSDLSALVKKNGPLSVEQAVQCILQAARGLEYAHEQGVVHRDIKPANLLLDAKGTVKILDMGLARIEGDSGGRAELTSTGAVMGTVDYMAPEQALSTKTADARSDIYSLGISLWYLLAGKCAYDGDTLMAKLLAHRDAPIPSLCALRAEVPASVDAVFQKMVAKQAKDRYQSMTDVIRDLTACQSGSASTTSLAASSMPEDTNLMSFLNNLSGPSRSVTATRQLQPTATHVTVDKAAEATMLTANAAQSTDSQTLASVGSQVRQKKRRSSKPAAAPPWWQDRRVQIGGGAATFLLLLLGMWVIIRDKDGNEVARVKVPEGGTVEVKPEISNRNSQNSNPKSEISNLASSAPPTKPFLPRTAEDLPPGFVPLFNGRDLTGWKGEVGDPKKRAQMTPAERDSAQATADERMRAHWRVENGILTFDGKGDNLCTAQDYADFELYLEWKITAGGDSGIYLRGAPQVQIWDSAAKQRGNNMGSGGLYNNRKHPGHPLVNADKPIGEWNKMFIRMVGDRVTVGLNGQLVIDNVVYENYVEPEKPIYASGPIELQKYGSPLQFRNVLIRVLNAGTPVQPSFALQFDGKSVVQTPGIPWGGLSEWTVEAWVRAEDDVPTDGFLVDRHKSAGLARYHGRWQFTVKYAGEDVPAYASESVARSNGEWEHVAGVVKDGVAHLYINGKHIRSTPLTKPLDLGQGQKLGLGNKLKASIRGVRYSKIARYQTEFTPPEQFARDANTLLLYNFDEGSGDVLKDSSGNNLHGKIIGAKWLTVTTASVTPQLNVAPSATAALPPPAKAPFDAQQARAHQEAWAKHLGTTVETTNSVGAKMILIPPGEFLMGSTDEQVEAALKVAAAGGGTKVAMDQIRNAERPQHRAVITKPFLAGATEVTIGQFRRFVVAMKYVTEAERYGFGDSGDTIVTEKITDSQKQRSWREPGYGVSDDSPVAQVSWNDATAYCKWLSDQEKTTYRLPTEAEWEYISRAGTTTQYSFGDDASLLDRFGWYKNNSGGMAQPVGTKLPNAFGLFDMHGNVYEWCGDFYDMKWYEKSPSHDAIGPGSGSERALRGGACFYLASNCRSTFRFYYAPSHRYASYGFRVVGVLDALATTARVKPKPAVPVDASPLDNLDPAAIPAEERFEYQP